MRSRSARADYQEAVSRRLARLTADLESSRAASAVPPTRPGPPGQPGQPDQPDEWWSEHTRVSLPAVPPAAAPPRAHSPPPPPTPVPAVRRAPAPVPAPVQAAPPPAVVPVPGRHAARRRGRGWGEVAADVVPSSLRGRARVGSAQLAVVAVLVAVGSLVTAWVVVRGDAEPASVPVAAPAVGQPLVPLSADAAGGGGAAAGDTGTPDVAGGAAPAGGAGVVGTVTVDVAGKVRRPGIAVLDAGSRVVDALEAAGGARPGVDLSSLNLARLLVDGEQVLVGEVPASGPIAPPDATAPGATTDAPPALVNLNTATVEQLDALPEVGPVTAAAIIAWREENGAFTSVDQLVEVDGIGEVTLGQIAPHATV